MARHDEKGKEKQDKKGGKGGRTAGIGGATIAAILLLLGGGAYGNGWLPGGSSTGSSENGENENALVATNTPAVEESEKNDAKEQTARTVIIKLEQAELSVDGEVCADTDAMITRINELYSANSKLTFEFKDRYAVNSKYQEVVAALKNTETILKIDIIGIE